MIHELTTVVTSEIGYIEGRIIYTNRALRRLLRYASEELAVMPVETMLADEESNRPVREHLRALRSGSAPSTEFNARTRTRNCELFDADLSIARLFFSPKNGYMISLRHTIRTSTQSAFDFYRGLPRTAANTVCLRTTRCRAKRWTRLNATKRSQSAGLRQGPQRSIDSVVRR